MSHNLPHLAVRGIPHVVKEDGRVLRRIYCRNAQALQTLGILLNRIEDGRASIPFDGYITPKLYSHWASSCMLLRDDATVINAFLRSRLSPPYGWGHPSVC